MTGKADFTEDEWTRLKRAPFIAGMAISLADPGGPIEAVKETAATLKTVTGSRGRRPRAVRRRAGREAVADARARTQPAARLQAQGRAGRPGDPRRAGRGQRDRHREGEREEADAYREWLKDAAQEAANAAKEGGFFGFHAVRVSEGEQRMLDKLAEALAPPS